MSPQYVAQTPVRLGPTSLCLVGISSDAYQAMIGCVVVGSAVHFAKVGPTSTARSPPRSTSRRGALWRPLVVPSNIGAKVKQAVSGGRPVTVIRVAAAAGRHSDSTASKVSTTTKTEIRVYSSPSSWSAQGKTRVIPLLTGGSNC